MRHGNKSEYKPVEPLDERLGKLAREFSELERLRLDVRRAEEMFKTRSKLARRSWKQR
jgi:hypothetical protein